MAQFLLHTKLEGNRLQLLYSFKVSTAEARHMYNVKHDLATPRICFRRTY